MQRIFGIIYQIYSRLFISFPLNYLKLLKIKDNDILKLNIGCGSVKIPNWINIDIEPGADLVMDVRNGLPFKDNSAEFIYNEHFIEHLEYGDGKKTINEFYRVLKKGGILRIATPDLDYIIQKYLEHWKDQDWLSWPEHQFIKTKGQMINISFRWWGHQYLYNEEDLKKLLINAGFENTIRCKHAESSYHELKHLETRKDSQLILEAEK